MYSRLHYKCTFSTHLPSTFSLQDYAGSRRKETAQTLPSGCICIFHYFSQSHSSIDGSLLLHLKILHLALEGMGGCFCFALLCNNTKYISAIGVGGWESEPLLRRIKIKQDKYLLLYYRCSISNDTLSLKSAILA